MRSCAHCETPQGEGRRAQKEVRERKARAPGSAAPAGSPQSALGVSPTELQAALLRRGRGSGGGSDGTL